MSEKITRSKGESAAAGITVAATWDSDLMYDRAFAMGEEFRAKGAHSMFGYSQPHEISSCLSY
jgi:beta-glucosidase